MVSTEAGRSREEEIALDAILALMRRRTGTDFGCYRPATIARRIANRMLAVGVTRLDDYAALLERSVAEPAQLLARLTIKVGRFYRNRPVFDLLRTVVLPRRARERGAAPLRIWSAGCAHGEEAYTLAMLLAEAGAAGTVVATDLDPGALTAACAAEYAPAALVELPAELAARYLEPQGPAGGRLRVTEPVRQRVRFALHDLSAGASPPAGGPFDLIACRNVLIYLRPAMQEQVLRMLRSALDPGGLLLLGEAEWVPLALQSMLQVVNASARLFCPADGQAGPEGAT